MSAVVPAAALAAVVYACAPPPFAVGLAVVAAAAGITCTTNPSTRRLAGSLVVCAFGVSVAILAATAGQRALQAAPGAPASRIVRVSGDTVGHAASATSGWQVILRCRELATENLTVTSDIDLVLTGTGPPPPPGTWMEARVDGLSVGSRGRWFARALKVTAGSPGLLNIIRARAYAAIARSIDRVAGEGAPLLAALLLGTDDDLSARLSELFRRAGLSHVLALSGMHLSIIAALVVGLARPLVGRRAAIVAGAAAALIYTLIIGPRPSLVRATLMCEIAMMLMLAERPVRLVELLAAAFLVHCLVQPAALGSLSFQLSYVALLGISAISPVIVRETMPWIPAAFTAPFAAGIGAQIAGAPILLSVFGRMYPMGIVAGAVAGPVVAMFMVTGILALVLSAIPLPAVARLTGQVIELLAGAVEGIAWWFSGAGGIGNARFSAPAMVFSTACIVAGLFVERRRVLWNGRN